ncbi:MAG: serine/threonine protein kinase, partial [Myxococcaceae bacterium]|nr:serine/threonine protein kinase [Myxococcaceae bacterium]
PYMVLEWLEGLTLATDLRKRRDARMGGRALEEAVRIFAPAAEALAYAHAHGVVHRDVKPGNLFLAQTREGYRLKVLDFGMAKILTDGSIGMSQLAKSVGTVQVFSAPYAAPEQFDTKLGAIGTWTDVYSLALVILETLVDRRVRSGDGLAECLMQACDPVKVASPRGMGLQVPDVIEDLFKRALAPKPTDRPQDVGEFWGQLRNAMLRDADKKSNPEYADMDSLPPDSVDNHDDPATIVADTSGMFDNQTSPQGQVPALGPAAGMRPAAGRPSPPSSRDDDEEPTRTVDLNATFPMGPGGAQMPNDVKDYLAQRSPAAGNPPPAAGNPALRVPRPFGNDEKARSSPPGRHPNAGAPIPEPLDFGAEASPNADGPSSDPPTMAMVSPAVEMPPHGAVPGGMYANTSPQAFNPPGYAQPGPAAPGHGAMGMTLPLNAAFPGGFPGQQPAQGLPGGGGAPMNAQYNPGASNNFAPPPQLGQAYNPQGSVPGVPAGMQGGMPQGGMPQGMQGGQGQMPQQQGGMPQQGGGQQGAMPAPMPMPMQSGYAANAQPGGVWGGNQAATVIRQAPEKSKASIFAVIGLVAFFVFSVGGYLTYSFFSARAAVKHDLELAAAKAKQEQLAASASASASAAMANDPMVPPIVTPSGTVFPALTATADTTATAEPVPTTTAAPTTATNTATADTATTAPTTVRTAPTATTAAPTSTGPTQNPTPTGTSVATSTRPTPLPTPTDSTAAAAEPGKFSPEAAQKSLRAMEGILASCKRADGPTGAGHVRVTFGNDGSVMSSVIIGAPFESTPVGDCAASRFKMSRVPKFEGPPGVTDYTFHINK